MFHGFIMKISPTSPTASTIILFLFIFSFAKKCANIIVNHGFIHISTEAVAALEFMMPSWKNTMLTGIPRIPTPASLRKSFAVSLTLFFFSSANANGSSISPPIANLRNVSWKGSSWLPASLHATSIVPNRNAVSITQIYAFFIKFTSLKILKKGGEFTAF